MPYVTDTQTHGNVTTITRYRVSKQCWCIIIIIKIIILVILLSVLGAEGVFSGHLFDSSNGQSTTTTSALTPTQTTVLPGPVEGYCDTQSFYFYTNSLCTVENNITYLYNMGYCSTTMANYDSLPSVVYIGNMKGQYIVFKQWNDEKCDLALYTSTFNINSNCFEYKLNETKYYSMC